MEFLKDPFAALPQTDSPLHILIIGAGVAGLTAAIGFFSPTRSILNLLIPTQDLPAPATP